MAGATAAPIKSIISQLCPEILFHILITDVITYKQRKLLMKKQSMEQNRRPVSDFGANIITFIEQVIKSKKPLILTESGKNRAVLLDINNYKSLVEELELLKDIRTAEEQIRNGDYLSDEEAKKRLLG